MSECDACGDVIKDFMGHDSRTYHKIFTVPLDEERVFEDRDYMLCFECQRRIIDWIDECQEDETRIDRVELEPTIRELEAHAQQLKRSADRLREFESE